MWHAKPQKLLKRETKLKPRYSSPSSSPSSLELEPAFRRAASRVGGAAVPRRTGCRGREGGARLSIPGWSLPGALVRRRRAAMMRNVSRQCWRRSPCRRLAIIWFAKCTSRRHAGVQPAMLVCQLLIGVVAAFVEASLCFKHTGQRIYRDRAAYSCTPLFVYSSDGYMRGPQKMCHMKLKLIYRTTPICDCKRHSDNLV